MVDTLKKKSGLGRGLSSLFDAEEVVTDSIVQWQKPASPENLPKADNFSRSKEVLQTLEITLIQPGNAQPRKHFSQTEIDELAQSIQTNGILQPLLVRKLPGDTNQYELIAGERRWRAAKLAGLENVPVIIRDLTDQEALQIALIENIQRENLNPIEEGEAYERLLTEGKMTQEMLAKMIGKSRSHVANMLRLNVLPESLKTYVAEGRLSMGHVRALLTIENPETVGESILKEGLSVRETERLVNQIKNGVTRDSSLQILKKTHKLKNVSRETQNPISHNEKGEKHPEIQGIEAHLYDLLGLQCRIDVTSEGAGSIVLEFKSFKELDQLLSTLMSIEPEN